MLERLYRTHEVRALHIRVSEKKIHVRLLAMLAVIFGYSGLCTRLDHITYRVKLHRVDERVYAGYRIVVLSSHEREDSLRHIRI